MRVIWVRGGGVEGGIIIFEKPMYMYFISITVLSRRIHFDQKRNRIVLFVYKNVTSFNLTNRTQPRVDNIYQSCALIC